MSSRSAPRIGLALAGGGPLGAVYEIGALCALEESITGLDLTSLDGYVGVSAGAFLAAGLANGMSPRSLCAAFIESGPNRPDAMDPSVFVQPAFREFGQRLAALPRLLADVARGASASAMGRRPWLSTLERLGHALPTGLFSNAPLERAVHRLLSAPGRTDDFRQLRRRLVVVATDLDSGEALPFGLEQTDVPISRAAAASAALPGLYPPVKIGGRWYVDGALKKTLHASVLLDMPLDLVLCVNPLVPFDASRAQRHRIGSAGQPGIPPLVEGGLPLVLSQTFRSLIRSRLELGMKGYEHSHPNTDIVLLEPDPRDPQLFLANVFSYGQRRRIAEHAYQQTRADLRSRRTVLRAQLARHGLGIQDAALDDPQRTLVRRRPPPSNRPALALRRLDEVLDDLERALALQQARAPASRQVEA